MENQDQLPEEEIINPEQFQVGRNPDQQGDQVDEAGNADSDQAGYTPGETEFADGAGTRLDQESEELDIDPDSDPESDPESDSDSGSSSDGEDADFENPEDDPA